MRHSQVPEIIESDAGSTPAASTINNLKSLDKLYRKSSSKRPLMKNGEKCVYICPKDFYIIEKDNGGEGM